MFANSKQTHGFWSCKIQMGPRREPFIQNFYRTLGQKCPTPTPTPYHFETCMWSKLHVITFSQIRFIVNSKFHKLDVLIKWLLALNVLREVIMFKIGQTIIFHVLWTFKHLGFARSLNVHKTCTTYLYFTTALYWQMPTRKYSNEVNVQMSCF